MKDIIKTELSYVAFIDLLGAKETIKNDPDGSLKIIHNCYESVKEYVAKWPSNRKLTAPKMKIFSDNIILSIPVDTNKPDGEEMLKPVSILVFSAYLQLYFLINNFMLRGAITCGSYYEDEMMAWGKGLVDAYDFESNVAIYPRIIIDPKISDIMLEACRFGRTRLLTRDFDGLFFVDLYASDNNEDINWFLQKFIEDNKKRINDNAGNYKVLQKLEWLDNYLIEKANAICDDEGSNSKA